MDVAVDDTGYADDGFWIYWDRLAVQYGACPPPGGLGVGGKVRLAVLQLPTDVELGNGVYAVYYHAYPRLDLRG